MEALFYWNYSVKVVQENVSFLINPFEFNSKNDNIKVIFTNWVNSNIDSFIRNCNFKDLDIYTTEKTCEKLKKSWFTSLTYFQSFFDFSPEIKLFFCWETYENICLEINNKNIYYIINPKKIDFGQIGYKRIDLLLINLDYYKNNISSLINKISNLSCNYVVPIYSWNYKDILQDSLEFSRAVIINNLWKPKLLKSGQYIYI